MLERRCTALPRHTFSFCSHITTIPGLDVNFTAHLAGHVHKCCTADCIVAITLFVSTVQSFEALP